MKHLARLLLLMLLAACPAWPQTLLVPPGSAWKYLDTGTNLGTAWRAIHFNDVSWPGGPAQLGYGDGDEATVVNSGPTTNRYITTYFRHTFQVATPGAFTNLLLGLLRDDGAVVYLNGLEVWRHNMPGGTITHTTPASASVGGADESTFYQTNLSPGALRPGTNVLAVEVHQNSGGSSDVSFDLYLAGFSGTPLSQLAVHVATNGNDAWTGASPQPAGTDGPVATLKRARDIVRFYASSGYLPPGGALIEIGGGIYSFDRSLDLNAADSGTAQRPIVWRARAGETPRLVGGRFITGSSLVTDTGTLARMDPAARGRVWQADLRALGLTNFPSPTPGTTWAQSDPGIEFFFQDKPMTLARYPNEGWMKIAKALGPTTNNIRGTIGTVEGIFAYEGDRPARWVGEPDVMVHGYWFWDWADQRHRVASIDTVSNILTLFTNSTYRYHTYGYRNSQWFYAYNLLPELDEPGEWYLDRQAGVLYFWPPAPVTGAPAMVSLVPNLVTVSNASFLTFEGFIFEGCQNTALSITGGASNTVRACTVRNIGKNGIRLSNSPGSGVTGCEIYFVGEGGISLSGGDRATLTAAGMFAEHNHIHHYSRWNPVYHAGVSLSGVGQRVAHNLIHDAPHEGIAFGGNDHLIEHNEFHNLVNESNDAGVIYGGRDWTMRGHVIRYNYFHHIYGFERRGGNCVYLDDQFSSALIYGNLFYEVPTAILIGGGRENTVDNNVFVNCKRAISLDARGLGWAASGFGDLSNKLVSVPYQLPPWSTRYPELTNILNENPMAPRGNLFTRNLSWMGAWTSIESAAQPGVLVTNNLVGVDPRFVDTNRLDFRLQPDSPAFAVGFTEFPLDQFGPDTNVPHAPWLPTVTLVQPRTGAVIGLPAEVGWEAVLSDPDQRASGVLLLLGNALLTTLTDFPHRFTWSNATPGAYALNALPWTPGEGLGPARPVNIRVDDALVAAGSTWKYLDTGPHPASAWRGTNFNDSAWPSGRGPFGYGDTNTQVTLLSYGPAANNKRITYCFRRAFTVARPSDYTTVLLGLRRDDGAAVYLNGDEIWRSNLPAGAISSNTLALTAVADAAETTYLQTNLSPALLRPGTNVIAVEVHQVNAQSSDLSFDLYLHAQRGDESSFIEVRREGAEVELSWSSTHADHRLEAADQVADGIWEPLVFTGNVAGDRVKLRLNAGTAARFFRLTKP